MIKAAYYGNVDELYDALRQGADIDAVDPRDGWTPLHAAAFTGMRGAVELLLRFGASTIIRDSEGKDAATIAAERGHGEILDLIKASSTKTENV